MLLGIPMWSLDWLALLLRLLSDRVQGHHLASAIAQDSRKKSAFPIQVDFWLYRTLQRQSCWQVTTVHHLWSSGHQDWLWPAFQRNHLNLYQYENQWASEIYRGFLAAHARLQVGHSWLLPKKHSQARLRNLQVRAIVLLEAPIVR